MPWREQYDRMKRWRSRLESDPARGETRDAYNERIIDYLHAFFVTCYHLRDWLAEDASSAVGFSAIDAHISKSAWLPRSRDIANGSKHAVLRTGGRVSGVSGGTTRTWFPLFGVPRWGRSVETSHFEIRTAAGVHLAIPAADECIREWEIFLRSKGLL